MFDKHTLLQFADFFIKCSNDDSFVDRTLFNKIVNYMLEHSLCYFNKDNGLYYPAILPKFGCGFSCKLTIKELNQIYIINKELFENYTVNYKTSRFHEIQSLSEDEIHIYSDLPFYSFRYFTDDLKCEYEKDEDDKITDYYPKKYNLNKLNESNSGIENFFRLFNIVTFLCIRLH